jgi:hypothetical protein
VVFAPAEGDVEIACMSRMRPDTPEPEAISIEEMNDRLFETARQASLLEHMELIAAQELAMQMSDHDYDEPHAQTLRSRSISPIPIEYNEHGQQTARSKGKSRAN